MPRSIILTLALSTLASVACVPEAPPPPAARSGTRSGAPLPQEDLHRGGAAVSLSVLGGAQRGDMGEVRGFDSTARDHTGEYGASYTTVRLDSVGAGWWVMSALNISGDLAGPEFAPGTHRTFTSGTWTDGEPTVSVMGCSGPEYGNYTFDAISNEVEISVLELPGGMRRMDYAVVFRDGATTRGSFDYVLGSSGATAPAGI